MLIRRHNLKADYYQTFREISQKKLSTKWKNLNNWLKDGNVFGLWKGYVGYLYNQLQEDED